MESQKKKVAIVLGGTNAHINLIKSLQQRGYFVFLVDYLENPVAKKFADKHIEKSTLDKEVVLEFAKKVKASLVISTSVDQANLTACYVAEKLGLPAPYSYKIAKEVTDKTLMKKKMIENNIPTARYIIFTSFLNFKKSGLNFPVIVKPVDNNGSKGVRKANNLVELKKYLKLAIKASRTKKAIIEEFKEGDEFSIYCLIQNFKVNLVLISKKNKINKRGDSVMQSYCSLAPVEVSPRTRKEILEIINNIVISFNLNNTPLFCQLIIKDEKVNVIEFSPRLGGGISSEVIKLKTGIDFIETAVDSYLKINKRNKKTIKNNKNYFLIGTIYARSGIFNRILGYKKLEKNKIIEKIYFYKGKGMKIGSDFSSQNRIGSFIIKDKNKSRLWLKFGEAINKLEVLNIKNEPIMIKDIYNLEKK